MVTRYLLALRHTTPAQFFRTFFFTYGHRNVVRAVATDWRRAAASTGMFGMSCGSESPELINKTRVVIQVGEVGLSADCRPEVGKDTTLAKAISAAFIEMPTHPLGREILSILELDGFTNANPDLYQGTLEKWLARKGASMNERACAASPIGRLLGRFPCSRQVS